MSELPEINSFGSDPRSRLYSYADFLSSVRPHEISTGDGEKLFFEIDATVRDLYREAEKEDWPRAIQENLESALNILGAIIDTIQKQPDEPRDDRFFARVRDVAKRLRNAADLLGQESVSSSRRTARESNPLPRETPVKQSKGRAEQRSSLAEEADFLGETPGVGRPNLRESFSPEDPLKQPSENLPEAPAPSVADPAAQQAQPLPTPEQKIVEPNTAVPADDLIRETPPETARKARRRRPVSPYLPPVAGYISDRADQELHDLLNIEREVANIANVLTFKQVQPPLALGLFGDWGSGKTFFLGKLRKYIGQITDHYKGAEKESGKPAMWCSRVVQIDFNAWHFSDSNLWASLVTRIYEGLDRELNREKETADDIKKKIIEAQIREVEQQSLRAESQVDLAKTRVNSAEETLKRKSREREEKETRLLGLIGSIPDLLKTSQFKQPLQEAANSLGMPEAAKTYEALEDLNAELKSVSGRLSAVTADILHSPRSLLWMALFIILLPVALTWLIETRGAELTEIGKRVAEVSTFLGFVIVWLQTQVRRGMKWVGVVESALQEARQERQKKFERDEDVVEARKALTEAQAEEQAARTNLELAQTELQRLQLELQELRPERKLQRLIEARASTGAYAQHLGIISLIRSDFESMSRILAEMVAEQRDFEKDPPIQRIILYIDDLDRCKPERVVEVLEAIHLLLFFPLFVVVVAVDPRWLRHSLSQHYPATLHETGGKRAFEGTPGISLYSTPQDYLEKIFQIPFALRPVEQGGYQNLVDDLLKPLPAAELRHSSEAGTAPGGSNGKSAAGQPGQTETGTPRDAGAGVSGVETAPPAEQERTRGRTVPKTRFTPIPPRQLEFTEWEKEDVQRLWRMFRTPRTVKRFINIYRLLRAGLVSDEDVKHFEGTKKKPGEYQVALLLLAAITAFPNEAGPLLYRLDAWLDAREAEKIDREHTWQEVIQYLKESGRGTEDIRPDNSQALETAPTNHNQEEVNTWKLMLDGLERVTQDDAWKKRFRLATLRFWVMRVARFSFSVQPA